MKPLTREGAHELADLLRQVHLWATEQDHSVDEPEWAEVEAFEDVLRSAAGLREPKSLSARFMARAAAPGKEWAEWALGGDGLWYALNGTRSDGLAWGDLLEAYGDSEYSIIDPDQEA